MKTDTQTKKQLMPCWRISFTHEKLHKRNLRRGGGRCENDNGSPVGREKHFSSKISPPWPSHRATLSRSLESPPPLIAALRPLRFPPISPCQPTYLPWHLETKHKKVKFARQHFRAWGNNTGWLARLRGHRNDDGLRCDSEVANQTQALIIHQFDSGQSVDMSQESVTICQPSVSTNHAPLFSSRSIRARSDRTV